METVISVFNSIPMWLGFLLGVLGIIPALPSMFEKPPSGWKHTSLVSVSIVIGAIGLAAGMTQVMSNSTL